LWSPSTGMPEIVVAVLNRPRCADQHVEALQERPAKPGGEALKFVWSFEKFRARLQSMRDTYEEMRRQGVVRVQQRLDVEPYMDPWKEFGGGDMQLLLDVYPPRWASGPVPSELPFSGTTSAYTSRQASKESSRLDELPRSTFDGQTYGWGRAGFHHPAMAQKALFAPSERSAPSSVLHSFGRGAAPSERSCSETPDGDYSEDEEDEGEDDDDMQVGLFEGSPDQGAAPTCGALARTAADLRRENLRLQRLLEELRCRDRQEEQLRAWAAQLSAKEQTLKQIEAVTMQLLAQNSKDVPKS